MQPNWRVASDYDFLKEARSELIAWQFLRRNPEYQQDYQWFITTWQQLELDYGAPPHRDFSAWKKDPRAYRSERDINFEIQATSDQGAVKDDQLLIECWMGAKWAFYKFPVNPDISEPVIGSELNWRTSQASVRLLSEHSLTERSFGHQNNKTAIIFDLNKNLKEQIQSAKQQLIIAQKNKTNKQYYIEQWIRYLRLIDALQSNASEAKIQLELDLDKIEFNLTTEKSQQMMLYQYREIISYR